MVPETEKKNRRIGMGVSLGIHALLLVLFFLVMAWREPDPPVPEYGIELNFGMDMAGSGDIQPEQPSATPQITEEQIISEEIIEESAEEIQDEVPVENSSPEESDVSEDQIIEDSEMEDSPDLIDPVESQPETPVDPEPEQEVVEDIPPQPVEKQTTQESPATTYEDATKTDVDGQGTSEDTDNEGEATSQGDDENVEGDKGDPQGTLDSRALYGNYGGGGGPLLELTGWIWDFAPDPDDTSNENGRIVFEIKIDDMGEIISVRTLETTVSPAVERIYKNEVESLTFSPISSTTVPATVSTGKITFIIRSK